MLTVAARCRSLGSRLGQRQLSCATLARQVMQDPDLLCCWRAAEPSRAAAGRLPPGRVANISMRRTSSPRLQCNRPIEGRRLACEEAVRSPARRCAVSAALINRESGSAEVAACRLPPTAPLVGDSRRSGHCHIRHRVTQLRLTGGSGSDGDPGGGGTPNTSERRPLRHRRSHFAPRTGQVSVWVAWRAGGPSR